MILPSIFFSNRKIGNPTVCGGVSVFPRAEVVQFAGGPFSGVVIPESLGTAKIRMLGVRAKGFELSSIFAAVESSPTSHFSISPWLLCIGLVVAEYQAEKQPRNCH